MNKGIIAILSFCAGGVAGYILANKVKEQDMEQRIQDEVDSVKAALKREIASKAEKAESGKKEEPAPEKNEVSDKKKKEMLEKAVDAHAKYSGADTDGDESPRRAYRQETKTEEQLHKMAAALKPRVISPDDLGDTYGEDNIINLTYYADGVLCGTDNKPLRDVDISQMVGSDFAEHFGEYEDDSVCIINDGLKAEYEILADERTYAQFIHEHPEMRLG